MAVKDPLRSGSEFWDSTKTLKFLLESDYFVDEGDKERRFEWPEGLKLMLSDGKIWNYQFTPDNLFA